MADLTDAPARVRAVAADLATPHPMRRGSLSERYVKCSKPGCACATQAEARHGPYYSLTWVRAGRTQSRFLSAEQAAVARRQVEAGRRFRQQVDAYWAACERWADAQLDAPAAASSEAAEKGGSPRPSTRRSPRKSRRSSDPA